MASDHVIAACDNDSLRAAVRRSDSLCDGACGCFVRSEDFRKLRSLLVVMLTSSQRETGSSQGFLSPSSFCADNGGRGVVELTVPAWYRCHWSCSGVNCIKESMQPRLWKRSARCRCGGRRWPSARRLDVAERDIAIELCYQVNATRTTEVPQKICDNLKSCGKISWGHNSSEWRKKEKSKSVLEFGESLISLHREQRG